MAKKPARKDVPFDPKQSLSFRLKDELSATEFDRQLKASGLKEKSEFIRLLVVDALFANRKQEQPETSAAVDLPSLKAVADECRHIREDIRTLANIMLVEALGYEPDDALKWIRESLS